MIMIERKPLEAFMTGPICSYVDFITVLVHVKKLLFKTNCTHFYCAQVWWFYSAEAFRKVNKAFNNSFRHLMGYIRRCSSSGMFVDENIDDFNVFMRKYVYAFNYELQICPNNIIVNIQIYRNCYAFPSVRECYRIVYSTH